MEFRYFFSIVFIVAIGIGVFGNLDVATKDKQVATVHTSSADFPVAATRDPHHQ